ncbi:MAG: response regulator [Pseudomonadota bacterium]
MAFKTALVVDDSKSARFSLRRFLENQYYKVETAESAEECYTVLRGLRPDVIFLDHVMPGADGFEVLRQIKSDVATSEIKVVICSSHDSAEFIDQAIAGGAVGVLVKPPSAEQLAHILNNLNNSVAAPNMPPPIPAAIPTAIQTAPPTPAPAAVAPPSKVANIREPDAAIEQRVMNAVRSTLSTPPPLPPSMPPPLPNNALNEVAQSLSVQIAQLQSQAVQLQTRIDEEQVAAKNQEGVQQLSQELALQSDRISALEKLVDDHFNELHAALEAGLRAHAERADQIAAAAGERAREEAERTMMNAAARISDQLASSILSALRNVSTSSSTPHSPAGSNPPETTDRLKA